MKKVVLLFTALFLISSCKQDNSDNQTGDNAAVIEKDNSGNQDAISDLNTKYSNEITGLWKHYKTVYPKGGSNIESDNSFIEIKQNKTFESNRYNGNWFLSFCKDSLGVGTLFTMVRDYQSDDAKMITYKMQKTVENNTTYLKLIDLRDGRQNYLIRQQ